MLQSMIYGKKSIWLKLSESFRKLRRTKSPYKVMGYNWGMTKELNKTGFLN